MSLGIERDSDAARASKPQPAATRATSSAESALSSMASSRWLGLGSHSMAVLPRIPRGTSLDAIPDKIAERTPKMLLNYSGSADCKPTATLAALALTSRLQRVTRLVLK